MSYRLVARTSALAGTLLLSLTLGCAADGEDSAGDDGDCQGAKCDATGDDGSEDRSVCVGVRGNGQLIFAHFASLARIVEHYGTVDGASGGSSGSVTVFLTESIQMNPQVNECGYSACTAEEAGNRAGLLFKSMQGYAQVLAQTPEVAAITQLTPIVGKIQEAGLDQLPEDASPEDIEAARKALLDLFNSEDLRDLINPEIVELVQNSPDPAFHIRDIAAGVTGLGSFKVGCTEEETAQGCNPAAIFIRPGLIDFEAFADKVGRIGNFYAGYGPYDAYAMEVFMEGCATPGRGLNWDEVSQLKAGGTTCGELFADILTDYRAALVADEDKFKRRVDDKIGERLPALISTSVLVDDAVDSFKKARADYQAGQPYTLPVDFDDVRFGYWGDQSDLNRVEKNPQGYDDAKTAKFHSLGEATWAEALALSPAEPGLARAFLIEGGTEVSAGGWSDLHPTLALRNLGCDEVVYVSRRGHESKFAQGIAREFGMDESNQKALYDLAEESAYALSLHEADAVWCTNWNDIPGTDIPRVSDDAYNAQMETTSEFFTGEDSYAGVVGRTGKVGCTPGIASDDAQGE